MADVTVSEGGYTVTSSGSETPEQISAILSEGKPAPDPDVSEAGSILGKKGGEAAAEARAAKAKEQTKAEKEAANDAASEPSSSKVGDSGEAQTDQAEPGADRPLGKPRDDPRARMLEATRKEAEAKRELARERAERERLSDEIKALREGKPAAEPTKAAPSADQEPQEADYDDYKDFVRAAARYEYRQAQNEAKTAEAATARDQQISGALQTFFRRVEEQGKADPEFMAKTSEIAQMLQPSFTLEKGQPIGPLNVMADEVIKSEHAPALMLHFKEHPEEIQRIQALRSVSEVQVEVRLLARTLAAVPQAPAPKVEQSQAKPPLRPVNGSPHTAETVPSESSSYEDHKRYWTRRDKERLAQR